MTVISFIIILVKYLNFNKILQTPNHLTVHK